MTLQEILKAVDDLPWDDLEKLQQHIDHRRAARQPAPMSEDDLRRQIDEILKDAEPVELVRGTMNVDELMRGIDAIREGLSQQELDEIVKAMNEEYVEIDEAEDA